jgi:hypothetical protein
VGIRVEDDTDPYVDPVGILLGRIGRGAGDDGGEFVGVIAPAEREIGLQESLRRQL